MARALHILVAVMLAGCASSTTPPSSDGGAGLDAAFDAGPASDTSVRDAGGGSRSAGTCERCATHSDCIVGHWCVPFTVGGSACVASCNPDIPDCPRAFNCVSDIASGVPEPVCEPVGAPCCIDEDADGWGHGVGCPGEDCDDGNDAVHPEATDVCNGVDDDCDGALDEDGGTEVLCADGEDNDCDGSIDCADPNCNAMSCGLYGVVCAGGACTCPGGTAESLCGDTADNDCDGQTDCTDSDCASRACDSLGRLCDAATGGCACPSTVELCNGRDDDCGGDVDEACPTALGLCCPTGGPTFGSGGGTAFTRNCASSSALVGANGRSGTRVDRIQPACAPISLRTNTAATPEHGFTLGTGATTLLAAAGGSGGTAFSDRCATNEVVIGIEGRSGSELDRIAFVCGRVAVQRTGSTWSVVITETGRTTLRGGFGGTAFRYICPAGRVATGIDGRAGTRLDALSLTCSQITVTTR